MGSTNEPEDQPVLAVLTLLYTRTAYENHLIP